MPRKKRSAPGKGQQKITAMAVAVPPVPKQKRVRLSFENKKKILAELEDPKVGLSKETIADKWNIGLSTVYKILNEKEDIRSVGVGAERFNQASRRTKPVLEDELLKWIEFARMPRVNMNITKATIVILAKKIRKRLLEDGSEISDKERKELNAWQPKMKWARKFVGRYKQLSEWCQCDDFDGAAAPDGIEEQVEMVEELIDADNRIPFEAEDNQDVEGEHVKAKLMWRLDMPMRSPLLPGQQRRCRSE